MAKRQYELLVWGATGFTGKWVAKHLFDHYSVDELNWGIAGRNSSKLQDVNAFIGDADQQIPSVIADSEDMESLNAMAASTKVVISTVGPYAYYGSQLIEACVNNGTHYVDLTGEVPWMRSMIDQYQKQAEETDSIIVHSCGFDSIPSDMGVYFTQQQAHVHLGSYLNKIQYALIDVKGGVSGGTIASMINVIKEATKDRKVRKTLTNPYSLNPDPNFKGPDKSDQSRVIFDKSLKAWTAPFLMAGINTRIVRRSNALMGFRYGEDFSYSETMVTGSGIKGYTAAKAISGGLKSIVATSITGIGRRFLGLVLPSQGQGPKVDPDKPGNYHIQFTGINQAGDRFTTQLLGDADPGYGSTSKMLAESGVCLALDSLKTNGGFWTPSSAMGDSLLKRLQSNAGLTFEVNFDVNNES